MSQIVVTELQKLTISWPQFCQSVFSGGLSLLFTDQMLKQETDFIIDFVGVSDSLCICSICCWSGSIFLHVSDSVFELFVYTASSMLSSATWMQFYLS